MGKNFLSFLLAAALVSVAAAENVILLLPANQALLKLGNDLIKGAPDKMVMACYSDSGAVEYYNPYLRKWSTVSSENWAQGSLPGSPKSLIAVGNNAVVQNLTESASWAGRVKTTNEQSFVNVVKAVDDFCPISKNTWKILNRKHNILTQTKAKPSRYDAVKIVSTSKIDDAEADTGTYEVEVVEKTVIEPKISVNKPDTEVKAVVTEVCETVVSEVKVTDAEPEVKVEETKVNEVEVKEIKVAQPEVKAEIPEVKVSEAPSAEAKAPEVASVEAKMPEASEVEAAKAPEVKAEVSPTQNTKADIGTVKDTGILLTEEEAMEQLRRNGMIEIKTTEASESKVDEVAQPEVKAEIPEIKVPEVPSTEAKTPKAHSVEAKIPEASEVDAAKVPEVKKPEIKITIREALEKAESEVIDIKPEDVPVKPPVVTPVVSDIPDLPVVVIEGK